MGMRQSRQRLDDSLPRGTITLGLAKVGLLFLSETHHKGAKVTRFQRVRGAPGGCIMTRPKLKAQRRTLFGKKVKRLRRAGKLPAILYGPTLEEPIPLELDYVETLKTIRHLGPSALVDVEVDGQTYPTIIRERQKDVITDRLLHVDFQAVSMTETVEAEVSIVLKGEAPAAKMGATIVQEMEVLDVEALPGDLPESIIVDLSMLKEPGDTITVADLVLPKGVRVLNQPDEVVVAAVEEEAEAPEEEAEMAEGVEPEVIEKGKKAEEE